MGPAAGVAPARAAGAGKVPTKQSSAPQGAATQGRAPARAGAATQGRCRFLPGAITGGAGQSGGGGAAAVSRGLPRGSPRWELRVQLSRFLLRASRYRCEPVHRVFLAGQCLPGGRMAFLLLWTGLRLSPSCGRRSCDSGAQRARPRRWKQYRRIDQS